MDKIATLFQYRLIDHMKSRGSINKLYICYPKGNPLLIKLQPLIPTIIQWIKMMAKNMIYQRGT